MPKGKLTPRQILALRLQIRSRITAGEKRMAVAKELGWALGITPAAVTWHIREELDRVRQSNQGSRGGSAEAELGKLIERAIEVRRVHSDLVAKIDLLSRQWRLALNFPVSIRRLDQHQRLGPGLQTLGSRLKELRTSRRWTLERLARAAKTNKSYLSGIERGRLHPPAGPVVERLAQALAVNTKELILLAYVDKAPPLVRRELLSCIWQVQRHSK